MLMARGPRPGLAAPLTGARPLGRSSTGFWWGIEERKVEMRMVVVDL